MRLFLATLVFAAGLFPFAAQAAPTVFVVPQIGSGGLGGSVAVGLDARTSIDVGASAFVYHQQQTFNNNEADISTSVSFVERLQLQQIPISVNRRIGQGPLAVGAGIMVNNDHLGASSIPFTENVTIAGTVYSAATAGQAFADVHWHHLAPLLSLSYRPRANGLTASAGAFFEGRPIVDIYETGAIAANRDRIANYISSFESQLRRALGPVTVYPIVTVGYRLKI